MFDINKLMSGGQMKDSKEVAKFIAMVVRNAMESFHRKNLSDEQMKELNPIVRNAVYTGIHALTDQKESKVAKAFVAFNTMSIPEYWEDPVLLEDYAGLKRSDDASADESQDV